MKTRNTAEVVSIAGAGETRRLTIAANAKAFKELISGIYSDKPFAVTRELFANAWDAQREAGCGERPFLVSAPNLLEPTFSVRDFGTSMTHDLVMNLYSQLFMSTKDNPDSEESNKYTGKFGLGSKTPFAYTDAFQLTTYLDGTMRAYDIFMNGGTPEISLFLSQPTTEENGVLVSFPVEQSDHKDFHRAIKQACEGLDVMPIVTGAKIDFTEETAVMSGSNWKMFKSDGYEATKRLRVRQGTVVYPLNKTAITGMRRELNYLFELNVRFDVSIGDLEVNTSREALSYDDYTISNLIVYLEAIHEELQRQITSQFKGIKTYSEFCKAYSAARSSYNSTLFTNVVSDFKFKGRKFSDTVAFRDYKIQKQVAVTNEYNGSTRMVTRYEPVSMTEYCVYTAKELQNLIVPGFREERGMASSIVERKGRYWNSYNMPSATKVVFVVESTVEKLRLASSRIRKIADAQQGKTPIVWMRSDADMTKEVLRHWIELGRPEIEIINLASVEITKEDRAAVDALKTPEYRVHTYSTTFRRPHDGADAPEGAYYVNMYRDEIKTGHNFSTLLRAYQLLIQKGLIENLPLIGVPASQQHRIKKFPGWVEFEPVVIANAHRVLDVEQLKLNIVANMVAELPEFDHEKLTGILGYTKDVSVEKKWQDRDNAKAGRIALSKDNAKRSSLWGAYASISEIKARSNVASKQVSRMSSDLVQLVPAEVIDSLLGATREEAAEKVVAATKMVEAFEAEFPLFEVFAFHQYSHTSKKNITAMRDYLKLN
jgi:hypothetical protein